MWNKIQTIGGRNKKREANGKFKENQKADPKGKL